MDLMIMKMLTFSVIKKAITYKSGSLFLISIPLSITFYEFVRVIVKDVELYDIILPIFVITSGFTLYTLFFFMDFFYGLIASKEEHKRKIAEGKAKAGSDWVDSRKLYSSFGKIGGVMLINVMMLFITITFAVTKYSTLSVTSMLFGSMLNILGALFEFHSIGENIERRTGKKPDYYLFFDKITTTLEFIIIKRLRGSLLKNETDYFSADTIQFQDEEEIKNKNKE